MPTENDGASNAPAADETPNVPQYVTPEQMGNAVNAAVTAHLKRLNITGMIETALKPITEKLNAPPAPPVDDGDDKSKSKKAKDPEFEAMKRQLETMTQTLEGERKQREAAEKKARDERAYSELRASLEGKVRPELLDIVAKNMFFVDQRVSHDESGNPVFKASSPYGEETLLPIRDGVAEFLKSDAAKPFLPAPNPGSGAPPLPKRGPSPTPGSGPTDLSQMNEQQKIAWALEQERRLAK